MDKERVSAPSSRKSPKAARRSKLQGRSIKLSGNRSVFLAEDGDEIVVKFTNGELAHGLRITREAAGAFSRLFQMVEAKEQWLPHSLSRWVLSLTENAGKWSVAGKDVSLAEAQAHSAEGSGSSNSGTNEDGASK